MIQLPQLKYHWKTELVVPYQNGMSKIAIFFQVNQRKANKQGTEL